VDEQLLLRIPPKSCTKKKDPGISRRCSRNGEKLRSLSWWREFRLRYTKHQPKLMNVAADIPATAGIIFRNFLSGKRRIDNEAK
jgi:hypothetical protein